MDRRTFLLLTFAGAADPGPGPQSGPPLLDKLTPLPVSSGDPQFDDWARDVIDRAIRDGWPADVLRQEFHGLKSDPRVLALDGAQPEFSKPVGDYVKGVVNDQRVAVARGKRASLAWLSPIQARFGVPSEILIAIWAVESAFGAIQGDFDVLRSVATLAAAGRRRAWADSQIQAVIRIIATHKAVRGQLRGSWAGAMGQTQFEPETYLTTAVCFEGGDAPDIWGSSQDALASAANLLAKAGWVPGQSWHREVILPARFDYSLTEAVKQPVSAWSQLGARTADGANWVAADASAPAMLILPAGAEGPAFLVFPNHFVIRQYNNSTAYALAVGLLADRTVGSGPLTAAWPPETPLSLAQRTGAQQALAKLGFDPGGIDGVIGGATRAALRAWQKARGLTADGYLSIQMVQQLQAEMSAAAALSQTRN